MIPFILATLILAAGGHPTFCSTAKVKGVIGDTDLSYSVYEIAPGKSLKLTIQVTVSILAIREVYPDISPQPRYTYDVLYQDRLLYRRDHVGTGFGPVTCFIYLPPWANKLGTINIRVRGTATVRIASAYRITKEKLAKLEATDSFGLFGMVMPYYGEAKFQRWLDELAEKLPSKEGFYRGYSSEIPYTAISAEAVANMIDRDLRVAKEKGLKFLPGFVSWWSGTPKGVPDGKGGTFTDVEYQQICYTPDRSNPDSPELRKLLGPVYNDHYCLSVPNQWSDTPWLTMNSPRLNSYRHKRLIEALRTLASMQKKHSISVEAIYLENEPRYWDTASEEYNYKRSKCTMWADFNPVTVADAKAEGITLDPRDGLDATERLWLVRNVARYNARTAQCARNSFTTDFSPTVFTHSLQLWGFPGDEIAHPMSEFAFCPPAAVGLEVMWSRLCDLERVREWGKWANVNREENDGRDIKEHLWDLRVTFARGGLFYNSYNWQEIGSDRFFTYVSEFLAEHDSATLTNTNIQSEGPRQMSFSTSLDLQGANRVRATISLKNSTRSGIFAFVENSKGHTIGFARAEGPFPAGESEVDFIFSEPFELKPDERGVLRAECEKRADLNNLTLKKADFRFDLRRERTQSLFVSLCASQQTLESSSN